MFLKYNFLSGIENLGIEITSFSHKNDPEHVEVLWSPRDCWKNVSIIHFVGWLVKTGDVVCFLICLILSTKSQTNDFNVITSFFICPMFSMLFFLN